MSNPKLSVCMITYNHAKFIRQAIESVLMQVTDFDYELIIGEDCSTDDTRKIVLEYKQKYPNKIQVLIAERNIGMMQNFLKTLSKCRGMYIAMLEGDDYWTDKLKLQKQVDFLEDNSDFSMCFHRVSYLYEEDNTKNQESNSNQADVTSYIDLCKENYIPTASVVYSKLKMIKLPDWFSQSIVVDWTLNLYNAQFGKIKFFEDNMAVYRHHSSGIWSTLQNKEQSLKSLQLNEFFTKNFPAEFRPSLKQGRKYLKINLFNQVRPQLIETIEYSIDTNNRKAAFDALRSYYKYSYPKSLKNIIYVIRKSIRILVGRSSK